MSSAAQELIVIVGGLPEDKAREVVDFARFLQQQAGDREWERVLAEKRTYPKLEQFAAASLQDGRLTPLCTGLF
jgi:hypothetical protein